MDSYICYLAAADNDDCDNNKNNKNNINTRLGANAQRDAALPFVGGALCSTLQSLADADYY